MVCLEENLEFAFIVLYVDVDIEIFKKEGKIIYIHKSIK